jgi:hypothetical protein
MLDNPTHKRTLEQEQATLPYRDAILVAERGAEPREVTFSRHSALTSEKPNDAGR